MADVNTLYNGIANAETGSFDNPWIRTTSAPKAGSTAFGPVQITKTKVEDYVNRGLVSPQSAQFYTQVLAPMYDKFNQYGRAPKKSGYDPAYDYGGHGNFNSEAYGSLYQQLAKEMMAADLKTAGGDVNKAIMLWRGKPQNADQRYYKAVQDILTAKHGIRNLKESS